MALTLLFVLVFVGVLIKVFCKLTTGRCKSPVCLTGKTVLITGGNSGIGFQTGLALAGRGCRLIIADKDNCEKSKENIMAETGNTNIVIKQFDLASLSSVRKLAKDINDTEDRLDILINNAGAMGVGNNYTEDGLHKGMQVNHFGAFLLTHLLVDLLKKSAPSRIIFVSSAAAYFNNLTVENLNCGTKHTPNLINEFILYGNAKLCNVITARQLAKKLKGTGVTSNALYPGIVDTQFNRTLAYSIGNSKLQKHLQYFFVEYMLTKLVSKRAEEGAQTTLHLALDKDLEKVTGEFFIDCICAITPGPAKDPNFSSQIWKASEDFVKLTPEEKL